MIYFFCCLLITATGYAQQDTVMPGDSAGDLYEDYSETSPFDEPARGSHEYFLEKSLTADTLVTRNVPKELVKKLKEDEDFWYADAVIANKNQEEIDGLSGISDSARISEKKIQIQESKATPLGKQPWFQSLLWVVIIVGFAGFVIWYLVSSNIVLFRKKNAILDSHAESDDLSTEDLFAINYPKEIEKAIRTGNYRLAIRLMFLRLLKELSERNIIEYKQGKTNLDYLHQLQTTRYYPDFFRVTRNYEYSWYGQFEVNEEKFSLIKKDFDQFENRLR